MTEPESIILQRLRAIRERVDDLHERQLEMMQSLGTLEVQGANLNLSVRVDRIDARLDRIERRLGLIEA